MTKKQAETTRNGRAFLYARVSTDEQDNGRQELELHKLASSLSLTVAATVAETVSSRIGKRQVHDLFDRLEPGDTVLVSEVSRLARSMGDLRALLVQARERGAWVESLSPRVSVTPGVNDVTTETLLFALGLAGQIERDMISTRTKSGLVAAKARGVKLGRPAGLGVKVPVAMQEAGVTLDELRKMLKARMPVAGIARRIGVARDTLVSWLRENDLAAK
jgi:DNA invertase Pin-like site-specific DNA recombinase